MSARTTLFYAKVLNAAGEPITVHLFSEWGKWELEVDGSSATSIFSDVVFEEDIASIDSRVLGAVARKLRAFERAQEFRARFGGGLWAP